ncbi:MAG TPA: hypothetical protein VK638_23320 [Edaphobacter sp.]|nr:hypothetical protein [Edaphobacter sp.]
MMQSNQTGSTAFEVLLVEDSAGDIRLTKEAFKDAKIHVNLKIATDGAEAMEVLNGRKAAGEPYPDLILLDLNLPKRAAGKYWRKSREIRN